MVRRGTRKHRKELKMVTKKLKLFVWEGVLADYTSGVMFALAKDVESARKMLLEKYPGSWSLERDILLEPKVYSEPFSFAVWGGS